MGSGTFSVWDETPESMVDFVASAGDEVTVEARYVDNADVPGAVGSATLTASQRLEDAFLDNAASEYYARKYETSMTIARQWMGSQDRAEGLNEEVAAGASGPGYAGVWFDNTTRRIKIGLKTGTSPTAAQTSASRLGLGAETDIVFTTYTQAALEQAQPGLETQLLDLIDNGKIAVSRDTVQNSIKIETATSITTAERSRVSQAAAGASVRVVVVDSTVASFQHDAFACFEDDCDPPLRGGVFMQSSQRDNDERIRGCASGFNVRSRVDAEPYVMTTGHCLDGFPNNDQSTWVAFGLLGEPNIIGPRHNHVYGDEGDAGIIRVASTSIYRRSHRPIVYVRGSSTGSTTRDPSYSIRRTAFNQIGRAVCLTGVRNGARCGEVTQLNVSFRKGFLRGQVKHLGLMTTCGAGPGG